MDTTIFLAKLIGIFCLVMGFSMFKREMMMEVFRELSRQRALSYAIGVWMLIVGLLIVLVHTTWETITASIITIFGWSVLLEAMVFLFASKEKVSKYLNTLENNNVYYAIAAGYMVLGAYLAYNGFIF